MSQTSTHQIDLFYALDLIRLSGLVPDQDISIQFSGIHPGEKRFQELFYGEASQSTVHPKVFEAQFMQTESVDLTAGVAALESNLAMPTPSKFTALITNLRELVPDWLPAPVWRSYPSLLKGGNAHDRASSCHTISR